MSSLKRNWGAMRITPKPPGWLAQKLPKEGVINWASYKVDTMWSGWGKSETGSWRVRTGCSGERFLDKLDFEEGALKRIDVKHAPPTSVPQDLAGAEREEAEAAWAKLEVPLVYPPSVSSAPEALSELRKLLQQRIPLHQKGFWIYLLVAPLTRAIHDRPGDPEFAVLFCAWRAWSHYQALRGARHVDALCRTPDTTLDAVYADATIDLKEAAAPADTADAVNSEKGSSTSKPTLIVTLMRALEMKPDEAKDVLRAYEQGNEPDKVASTLWCCSISRAGTRVAYK
ncbi:mitochondrial K+-H+ exchange-related-domain-containing protein [Mycena olivaceomarginata]|nr:mitochondrial K+-H+ exchange-related-domain-containing protein [Mycena olivaceomarginata]